MVTVQILPGMEELTVLLKERFVVVQEPVLSALLKTTVQIHVIVMGVSLLTIATAATHVLNFPKIIVINLAVMS
jgi:hypothetical protein